MPYSHPDKQFDRPVIIIAAARSGTKMLREVLAQSAIFAEFTYDMNYIWLYGNYKKKHDELIKEDVTPAVKKFIRKHFEKLLKNNDATRVLEKSVPNSLRVEFVRKIFPDAQIIHLYRNGIDVSADAMQCWNSSLFSQRIQKKSDLFKKIIAFPYISAFPYLIDYLANYMNRLISKEESLQSWGPRYKGIADDIERLSLIEVCGIQWARSVRCTLEQLAPLQENHDYINVQYENLVQNPQKEIRKICDFLDISDSSAVISYGQKHIRSDFIAYHEKILRKEDKKKLMPRIESELQQLGYFEK